MFTLYVDWETHLNSALPRNYLSLHVEQTGGRPTDAFTEECILWVMYFRHFGLAGYRDFLLTVIAWTAMHVNCSWQTEKQPNWETALWNYSWWHLSCFASLVRTCFSWFIMLHKLALTDWNNQACQGNGFACDMWSIPSSSLLKCGRFGKSGSVQRSSEAKIGNTRRSAGVVE